MGTKRRIVPNFELRQACEGLVAQGRYRSLAEFMREAVDEKLDRVEAEILADEVERYCVEGHAAEDSELIAGQHC